VTAYTSIEGLIRHAEGASEYANHVRLPLPLHATRGCVCLLQPSSTRYGGDAVLIPGGSDHGALVAALTAFVAS